VAGGAEPAAGAEFAWSGAWPHPVKARATPMPMHRWAACMTFPPVTCCRTQAPYDNTVPERGAAAVYSRRGAVGGGLACLARV